MRAHIKRSTIVRALALALGAIILACILIGSRAPQAPPPAPVVIMSRPYAMPPVRVGLLDRVMPRGRAWVWLWRLRYALLGRTRNINLDSTIIDFTDSDISVLADLVPAKPDFAGTDGMQVWRLGETDLQALKKRLDEQHALILTSPRLTTGDKTQSRVYCGNSILMNGTSQQVGFTLDLLPCLRKGTVDLTAVFCSSEAITNSFTAVEAGAVSVRTNLEFGGRFQLPQGMAGIFVLAGPPDAANEKRLALLLTSRVQKTKK